MAVEDYDPIKALIRINDLVGEILALHAKIPGLPAGDSTHASVIEATDQVRKIVAHSVARGLSKGPAEGVK